MKKRALSLLLLLAAAPPREMQLDEAPPPVQKAVRAEPGLAGMKIDALEVQQIDLSHDGHAEWLVMADATDSSGLHPVNRPVWLFQKEGDSWRLVDFLGYQLKVESIARGRTGGWDDLWTVAKDGVRQRCTLLGWDGGHYRSKGCCDAKSGTPAACPHG